MPAFIKADCQCGVSKHQMASTLKMIGKLLFVRNIETEYNVDFVSVKAEDIFSFRIKLEIEFIKKTNWDEGPQFVFL